MHFFWMQPQNDNNAAIFCLYMLHTVQIITYKNSIQTYRNRLGLQAILDTQKCITSYILNCTSQLTITADNHDIVHMSQSEIQKTA